MSSLEERVAAVERVQQQFDERLRNLECRGCTVVSRVRPDVISVLRDAAPVGKVEEIPNVRFPELGGKGRGEGPSDK